MLFHTFYRFSQLKNEKKKNTINENQYISHSVSEFKSTNVKIKILYAHITELKYIQDGQDVVVMN